MYILWKHAFNWAIGQELGADEAEAYANYIEKLYPAGEGMTASTSHVIDYQHFLKFRG